MVRIIFSETGGRRYEVDAAIGGSLMEAAIDNDIETVLAECGGCCSCATCHCFIEVPSGVAIPPPDELEEGLLETIPDRTEHSRLSCQVLITDEFEGLEIGLPTSQV